MSFHYNPKIVTDGLIAYLDAANVKSYPGTGTTWTDLTGNGNNGTLTNGPTFSTANKGVFDIDNSAAPGKYIKLLTPAIPYVPSTFMAVTRRTSASGRIWNSWNTDALFGHYVGTEDWYENGFMNTMGSGTVDSNWRVYAITHNTAAGLYSMYVNGLLKYGPYSLGSANHPGPDGFAFGCAMNATGEFGSGQVGFLSVYNRILSAAEILQNFNALRGRYGL